MEAGRLQDRWRAAWLTGTYDPELDLVYWGTGNGGPWNAATRGADSLYIGSVLVIRPSTGAIVWHFQFSPGDPYDYDGTNELVLAELANLPGASGKTKVLMQANRNGFFYVIDRTTGKLISATPFARKINWASGIDKASGRPIDTPMTTMVRKSEETDFIEVWPSAFGGKNWMPMSFDPQSGLVFLNSIDLGMKISTSKQTAAGRTELVPRPRQAASSVRDGNRGALTAWDPVAGKPVWRVLNSAPFWACPPAPTAGVVFTGSPERPVHRLRGQDRPQALVAPDRVRITGLPITWESDGRQYVTVLSGAATVYGALAGDPDLVNVPAGGSVWTFALPPAR